MVRRGVELIAEDGVAHGVKDDGGDIRGAQEFLKFWERFCGAFPDFTLVIEDAFGAGDKAVLRWSAKMRHTSDHLGPRAIGRPVALSGVTIARIANGKIAEAWDSWDKLGMLQQIGVVQLASSSAA